MIDDHFVDAIAGLHLKRIWVACDSDASIPGFKRGMAKLRKILPIDKISCYCLSYGKDMAKDEARARMIFEEGAMPFVQLYQKPSEQKTAYSKEWRDFQRTWCRPAVIRTLCKGGNR